MRHLDIQLFQGGRAKVNDIISQSALCPVPSLLVRFGMHCPCAEVPGIMRVRIEWSLLCRIHPHLGDYRARKDDEAITTHADANRQLQEIYYFGHVSSIDCKISVGNWFWMKYTSLLRTAFCELTSPPALMGHSQGDYNGTCYFFSVGVHQGESAAN